MIGRTSTRILLPCLAGGLALLALAAGCTSTSTSSSASGSNSGKPSYCSGGQQLKTSVQDLGKANVATGGMSSAQGALKNVQTSAQKFDTESKGAFSSQTTALRNALSGLQTDLKSLHGMPSTAQLKALVSQGGKVKTAATNLQSAWSAKCK
jgi:hypothetical protein